METEGIQALANDMARGQYGIIGVLVMIFVVSFKEDIRTFLRGRRNGGNGKVAPGLSQSSVSGKISEAEWRGAVGARVDDIKGITVDTAGRVQDTQTTVNGIAQHMDKMAEGIETIATHSIRACPHKDDRDDF